MRTPCRNVSLWSWFLCAKITSTASLFFGFLWISFSAFDLLLDHLIVLLFVHVQLLDAGDWLGCGLDDLGLFPWGEISWDTGDWLGCGLGDLGLFSWWKIAGAWTWPEHSSLYGASFMNGTLPLLPHLPSWKGQGQLYVHYSIFASLILLHFRHYLWLKAYSSTHRGLSFSLACGSDVICILSIVSKNVPCPPWLYKHAQLYSHLCHLETAQ